ncbi:MAG: hypothetical protein ABEL04_02850 [Salinibacter sp.]|uniref:hypothetical protein n=1 Tax=Salinibacter sp. TaxID=2065818 RepID=UPI0035D4FE04
MSSLPDGEYLLTNVQWRKENEDGAFRPLHGFTTGKLTVDGASARVWARFNDQFLSNRLSDIEQDETPIRLQVAVIETDEVYLLACPTPELDRSGASYKLKADGELHDARTASTL